MQLEYINERKAWLKMAGDQIIDATILRPEIAASWERSKGIDLLAMDKPRVSDKILQEKLNDYSELILTAHPTLEDLSTMIDNCIVCLADKDGVLLDVVGNTEICPPGSCLQESVVGTNAVGLTLIEKNTTHVFGYEHYRKCMHSLYSIGTPIWFESEIIGVLHWTSIFEEIPAGYIQILEYAANAIETFLKRSAERNAIIDASRYGIIIINEYGKIFNINKSALYALGAKDKSEIIYQQLSRYVVKYEELMNELKDRKFKVVDFKINTNDGVMNCKVKAKQYLPSVEDSKNLYLFAFTNHGKDKPDPLLEFNRLIGSSAALKKCKELAMKAAGTNLNILISGESGTGKELLTQAIHAASKRQGSFVPINCGAIPKELLQSELFGYEEGSFTGAKKGGAVGKFELADGGTLFLDEIGEMPLDMQVSLLRFLQDKNVYKVGSNKPKHVDVRVIAATNRNLEEAIMEGKFREDLYYRLNVINISIPPLRKRIEDIPELVQSFIDNLYENRPDKKPSITDDTFEILTDYYWPGNVRELRNVIEYAVVCSDDTGQITPECLPSRLFQQIVPEYSSDLKSQELIIINKALAENEGNISQTARYLGITRSTLYRKIKELNLASTSKLNN